MRLGEALALRWSDIDWNGKYILVQRSYKLGKYTTTKTGRDRQIDMADSLFSCLKDLQLKRKKKAMEEGRTVDDPVFTVTGNPFEQNHVRRVFKRVLEKAGLRERRIHDIRHTYASLLLSSNVSVVYVKNQLGHSRIEMTVDTYGKWIRSDQNRGLVNALAPPFCTLKKKKPVTH